MSGFIPVEIIGTGYHVPETILDNEHYEKKYGIPEGWIKKVSGIESRRMAHKHEACSHLAIPAAKNALRSANVMPEEVDLIILASISPDYSSPPSSCMVQAAISAKNAACFDMDCACLGYVWALQVASQLIQHGRFKTVLVIASETGLRCANFKDPKTFILLGDGAGASVLRKGNGESGIVSSYFRADGEKWEVATIKIAGGMHPDTRTLPEGMVFEDLLFRMDGQKIYKFAVRAIVEAVDNVTKQAGLEKKDIKLVIPHQANLRILESAVRKAGIRDDQIFVNVHKYGNTGGATIAIALAEAHEKGRIKKGDHVVLTGFGAGLSWGAILLKW